MSIDEETSIMGAVTCIAGAMASVSHAPEGMAASRRTALVTAATIATAAVALAPSADAQAPACAAWEVEYALSANLRLSDTPLGQGDGVYPIGPGRVVLRFEDAAGHPGGRVQMQSYEMREHFTVQSKALVWTTTVVTDTRTGDTPDACGVAAEGRLAGNLLGWSTPVRGYRTDGTLTCDGSMCGKFGAPPSGQSPLHIGPAPVPFEPFEFAADTKTFKMAPTFVAKTEMPKQTAHLALSGREVRRTCVAAAPACR